MIKFAEAYLLLLLAFGVVALIALMVTWLSQPLALVLSTLLIVLVILCVGFIAEEA